MSIAKAIAGILRSSLDPKGMEKMLQIPEGEVIIIVCRCSGTRAKNGNGVLSVYRTEESLLDDALVTRVSGVTKASLVLEIIAAKKLERNDTVLSNSDCCEIIAVAIDRNNCDFAISVFHRCSTKIRVCISRDGDGLGLISIPLPYSF